jgi:hypothetical protein
MADGTDPDLCRCAGVLTFCTFYCSKESPIVLAVFVFSGLLLMGSPPVVEFAAQPLRASHVQPLREVPDG